jgi:hypothetical protein
VSLVTKLACTEKVISTSSHRHSHPASTQVLSHGMSTTLTPSPVGDPTSAVVTVDRDEVGFWLHGTEWIEHAAAAQRRELRRESAKRRVASGSHTPPPPPPGGFAAETTTASTRFLSGLSGPGSHGSAASAAGSIDTPPGDATANAVRLRQQVFRDNVAAIFAQATKKFYPDHFTAADKEGKRRDFKHFVRKYSKLFTRDHSDLSTSAADVLLAQIESQVAKYFEKHKAYPKENKSANADAKRQRSQDAE